MAILSSTGFVLDCSDLIFAPSARPVGRSTPLSEVLLPERLLPLPSPSPGILSLWICFSYLLLVVHLGGAARSDDDRQGGSSDACASLNVCAHLQWQADAANNSIQRPRPTIKHFKHAQAV
eukprot:764790-Hanusia_phi.AAC.5